MYTYIIRFMVNCISYIHFNREIHPRHFSTAPASQRMKYLGAPSKHPTAPCMEYLLTLTPRWPSFVYIHIYIYSIILYIIHYIYILLIYIYTYYMRNRWASFLGNSWSTGHDRNTTFCFAFEQIIPGGALKRHGLMGCSSKIQHGKIFTQLK